MSPYGVGMASVGTAAAAFAAFVAATSARKIAWKSRGPGRRPPVRSGIPSNPGGLPVGPGSEVLISATRGSSADDHREASGDDRVRRAECRPGLFDDDVADPACERAV